jgi:hypothetical protein
MITPRENYEPTQWQWQQAPQICRWAFGRCLNQYISDLPDHRVPGSVDDIPEFRL